MSWNGLTSEEKVFYPTGVLLDCCVSSSCSPLRKQRKTVRAKQLVSGELVGNFLMTRSSIGKVSYPKQKLSSQECSSTEKAVVGTAFSGSWVNFHSEKNPKPEQIISCCLGESLSFRRLRFPACLPSPSRALVCYLFWGTAGPACSQGGFYSSASLTQYLPAKALGALMSHLPSWHLGHQTSGCISHLRTSFLTRGQSCRWYFKTA